MDISGSPLVGVRIVALKTTTNQLFIPSTKNYFAGIQVKKVKIADGADSVLLFISDWQMLNQLDLKFPAQGGYDFALSQGTGISSKFPLLAVSNRSPHAKFSVKLSTDILPNNRSSTLSLETLKFALCSEDIRDLFRNRCVTLKGRLSQRDFVLLTRWANSSTANISRRTHALLGQKIISQYSNYEYRTGVRMWIDESVFNSNQSFDDVRRLNLDIKRQLVDGDDEEYSEFIVELEQEPNFDMAFEDCIY